MSVAGETIDTRPSIDTFAAALMIALTFSWGLNQVAVKVANVGFNPVFSVLVRSAIGGLLVLAIAASPCSRPTARWAPASLRACCSVQSSR